MTYLVGFLEDEMTTRSLPHHPSQRAAGPLSSDLLVDIATGLATAYEHGALAHPVAPTAGVTRHRVLATSGYDVWVHVWAPGATADAHDHDGSVVVVHVIEGALTEHLAPLDGGASVTQLLATDSVTELDALATHGIGNPFAGPAVSIHVYSPPIGDDPDT
jgi:hypothetical protein